MRQRMIGTTAVGATLGAGRLASVQNQLSLSFGSSEGELGHTGKLGIAFLQGLRRRCRARAGSRGARADRRLTPPAPRAPAWPPSPLTAVASGTITSSITRSQ